MIEPTLTDLGDGLVRVRIGGDAMLLTREERHSLQRLLTAHDRAENEAAHSPTETGSVCLGSRWDDGGAVDHLDMSLTIEGDYLDIDRAGVAPGAGGGSFRPIVAVPLIAVASALAGAALQDHDRKAGR